MCRFGSVVLVLILCLEVLVAARGNGTSLWKTLSGNPPLVIARGGFSGLFPDSSSDAYLLADWICSSNVILWCDVQLTKDRAGICFPDLKLENASDISSVYSNADKTYLVDGESMKGWFSVDFTLDELQNVFLSQGIFYRPPYLDGLLLPLLPVQNMSQLTSARLWLNIEHDAFFTQQNLSMRSFVLSVFKSAVVNYISSPEVIFLKGILSHKPTETKLIFRFREKHEIEPSTNQTYDSLSTNLSFIKTFAYGILVPKTYIWPMEDMYLLQHTSIVSDAHKEGLEVFASGFANDYLSAYNFSYDPLSEYMYYFDNKDFSVDGLLSDFPGTPLAAINCYSHIAKNKTAKETPLVISSKGSSGNYPGCTNLAYHQAITDGVDVLDCPVQMSKDGVPFCLGSINLVDSTTILEGNYSSLQKVIPQLGGSSGIFTFDLTWSQIQSLTPVISTPYAKIYNLYRNPGFKNAGKFMNLSDFLSLANNYSSVIGVLIKIENAAYLAKSVGFSVTEAVLDALNSSQIAKTVMIQSTNSSVLRKLKEESNYKLVYEVKEEIRSADKLSIEEIKKFADSVVVRKSSIFPDDNAFLIGMTDVVQKLHAFNLSVYVGVFRNEFVSQAWDFFSDPYMEINSFVVGAAIDGVITEYPKTAASYKRNRCLRIANAPPYASPVEPGSLLQIVPPHALPPADPPSPVLTKADVIEPPLPAAGPESPPPSKPAPASPASSPSGQPRVLASLLLSCTFS